MFWICWFNIALMVAAGVHNDDTTESENSDDKTDVNTVLEGRNQACDVLIGIDQPLWLKNSKNVTIVQELAKNHIAGLNGIFAQQVFTGQYASHYFRLKRVEIVFGSCEGHAFEDNYEKNCTQMRENFLNAYDEVTDTSDFCLAFLLTYRDFHNGTAGLASIGTACLQNHNSGFVTMLNFGQERSLSESITTMAHEVAHTFNAIHDNNYETDEECYNQGFIMDELHNVTLEANVNQFSPCSLRLMKSKLSESACFSNADFDPAAEILQVAVCGNGVVEPGEQCDCGETHEMCDDPCCYPAIISPSERASNTSAKSCQKNRRTKCLTRPGLIFGFYIPWAVIAIVSAITTGLLYRDWHGNKKLFVHVTQNRIRIVN